MLSRGDVWVGITIKQNSVEGLKRFNSERYGSLGFPNPAPKSAYLEMQGEYPIRRMTSTLLPES